MGGAPTVDAGLRKSHATPTPPPPIAVYRTWERDKKKRAKNGRRVGPAVGTMGRDVIACP